jgi:hypothetical protein
MSEESKYYTPEKEECYIGFKYELNGAEMKTPNNSHGWESVVFGQNLNDFLMPTNPNYDLMKRNIRVKYLDKKDIESCGWHALTVIDGANDGDELNYIDGYEIKDFVLHKKENLYFIYERKEYHESNKATGNWQQNTLFQGTIKNISELKKIMKQKNIL